MFRDRERVHSLGRLHRGWSATSPLHRAMPRRRPIRWSSKAPSEISSRRSTSGAATDATRKAHMTDTGTRREDDQQSSALMTLILAIASRDGQKASHLLDASPGLAQQVSKIGASRQVSAAYYFKEIEHYVYVGDTALHIAAAAYAREISKKLLAKGA